MAGATRVTAEEAIGVAPLTDATYHFVAATAPEPSRPLGDHVALLTHPQIADWLVTWLQSTPGGPAARCIDQEAVSPTGAG